MSTIKLRYVIEADNFVTAGEASSNVKKKLSQLGVAPHIIKRAAVAMYEAEINAVIHGGGGHAVVDISEDCVVIRIIDKGPGIPDVSLAMTAGYSTAPDSIREMGFGAGMGLPNIQKHSDKLEINTEIGKGTEVIITVLFN